MKIKFRRKNQPYGTGYEYKAYVPEGCTCNSIWCCIRDFYFGKESLKMVGVKKLKFFTVDVE